MVLTGRMMDAAEAERSNLVARVVPTADLLDEARQARRDDRREVAAGRRDGQGRRSTSPTRPACPRASAPSAACSTRPSPPRTAGKACRPSSRSAPRLSAIAEAAIASLTARSAGAIGVAASWPIRGRERRPSHPAKHQKWKTPDGASSFRQEAHSSDRSSGPRSTVRGPAGFAHTSKRLSRPWPVATTRLPRVPCASPSPRSAAASARVCSS